MQGHLGHRARQHLQQRHRRRLRAPRDGRQRHLQRRAVRRTLRLCAHVPGGLLRQRRLRLPRGVRRCAVRGAVALRRRHEQRSLWRMPRSPLGDGGSALASSTRVLSTAKPVCPWVQPWRLLRRALAPRNAALLPSAGPGDSLWDFDACETILLPEGQSRAICSCTGLEFVSVLSHRLRPASALLDSLDPEWSTQAPTPT